MASLKHIALPGYAIFRAGDHYKLEKGILASAEVLDISNNLFSDFSEILTIIGLAPSLKELILSNNRFEQIAPTLTANRNQIRLLVLNDCFYDSETLMNSLLYFPCVEELHLSQNCFKHDFVPLSSLCPKLKSLFLDACGIQTWEELSCLGTLSSLKKLSLARNNISRLNISTSEDCSDQKYSFKQLEFINLSGNGLKGLRVINELTKLQSLKSLRIDDLVTDNEESVPRFQFIGRLKCLLYLNGSFISDTERRDCEMMYIKYICEQIMQHGVEAGETIFPRFEELKNLYADYFSEKLRELKPILHSQQVVITLVDETNISKTQDWTRKLPCSTPVRKLKQIAAKQFQLRQVDQLVLYYQLKSSNDDSIATFYLDDDSRPLSYFGIENGTVVFIRQRDTV